MKVSSIFAVQQERLYSIHFEGMDNDELSDIFNKWNDIEYLHDFFTQHKSDLLNRFYEDQYSTLTVEEAIEITLDEVSALERKLISLTESGESLQTLFKPLDNNDYRQNPLQKNKLTGPYRKSWLRIYAIRIGPNLFVISGGAIKLTPTMNDVAHLRLELVKLEAVKNFLQENGVLDEDDFELLEI
jgi:hypothetical protein